MTEENEEKEGGDKEIIYPLVLIKWIDSYGCSPLWEATEDLNPQPHYCYSVGWIVKETPEVVVIIPHMSPSNEDIDAEEQGCGDMTIPVVCIKKRTHLRD